MVNNCIILNSLSQIKEVGRINNIVLAGRDPGLLGLAQEKLSGRPGLCVRQAAGIEALADALRSARFDAAWLAYDQDFEVALALLRALSPTTRAVAFTRGQGLASLRRALLLGASDLISLDEDNEEALDAALGDCEAGPVLALTIRPDEITAACQRALLLRKRLNSDTESLFFLNANRLAFLLIRVVPLRREADYHLRAMEALWLQQLGVHSAMIFPAEQPWPGVLLGASLEMSYADQRSAEKSVHEQFKRFFLRLESLGCVGVATACSADLLNLSVFHRMVALCDLAFYARSCAFHPYNFTGGTSVVLDSVYHQFSALVTAGETERALNAIRALAERLRQELPAPAVARKRLLHFLFVYGVLRQKDLMSCAALALDQSHIDCLTDSLCRVIRAEEAVPMTGPQTPLDQLIAAIDRNPGALLNIDSAAAQVGFSRSHFCRLFRQRTGQSFTAYQIRRRIDMAAQLLRGTELSVAQISRLVGMDNTWYFRKVFTQQQGQTPENYRGQAVPPRIIETRKET